MALLPAVLVSSMATNVPPLAAGTSNTISAADIGARGVALNIINGGGAPINVTIADPGSTPAGNAGSAAAQAVANGTDRWFKVLPAHVNAATGVATVTLSSATSVTYKLIRL